MVSRFDYVKYDVDGVMQQGLFKGAFMAIDESIQSILPDSDYRKEAIKHLEISYMMIGKAIRDEQIERNGSAPLQEERNDG